MNLEERVELLEFQQELLFSNSPADRYIYESKITRDEYLAIADLMNLIRERVDNGEKVSHGEFESEMYKIVPSKYGDYHFCELIAKLFAEEGRWKEVFPAIYGDMPKYAGWNK